MKKLLATLAVVATFVFTIPFNAMAHEDRDWFAGVPCGPDHLGMTIDGWFWQATCGMDWYLWYWSCILMEGGECHEHYFWNVSWV